MKKVLFIIVLIGFIVNIFAYGTVTCNFIANGINMNIDYTLKCYDYVEYQYYFGNNVSVNTTSITSVDVEIADGYFPVRLEACESNTTDPVFVMTSFFPTSYNTWESDLLTVNATAVYLRLQAEDADVIAMYTLYCSDYSNYSGYNINLSTTAPTLVYIPINVNTYPTYLEVEGYSNCGHSPLITTNEFQFGEVPELQDGFEYWWNGHFNNGVWHPLYIPGYPYINVTVFVYTNIYVEDAEITYSYDIPVEEEITIIQDLKKGWTEIPYNDVCIGYPEAEVIANGVGGETYTLITNDFIWNSQTQRYEGSIEFCFENKPLHLDWNWESLPKLGINSTTNNGETNMVTLLVDNIVPGGYNWLNVLGEEFDLEYNPENTPPWNPDPYLIRSSDGFKIKLDNPQENRIYCANGMRVLENTTIVLHAGWNWIGYWLPYSQMSDVAFGENWSNVNQMKSEDWYYDDCRMERGFPGAGEPITWSPKPLHYGEGYMVNLYEPINNFYWETSEGRSENFNKPESDYFSYEKKADYEVIDVINVDTSISEIGVFADGVCVGAVVVQDSSEQILVYSDNFNRDPLSFDFEVITSRGLSIPIKNYEVFNPFTGEFEQGIIISGMQEYSIIMLGVEGEQEDNTPSITKLHSNYPNPFNPSTTISFSVPQTSPFVTLKIFNIKGQKVKTLYKGKAEEGKNTITWNGEDENDKPVSSGIYFYKLKTGKQELSRKMLLLK